MVDLSNKVKDLQIRADKFDNCSKTLKEVEKICKPINKTLIETTKAMCYFADEVMKIRMQLGESAKSKYAKIANNNCKGITLEEDAMDASEPAIAPITTNAPAASTPKTETTSTIHNAQADKIPVMGATESDSPVEDEL